MSVINDMLNDLEKRRNHSGESKPLEGISAVVTTAPSKKAIIILVIMLLSIGVISASVWMTLAEPKNSTIEIATVITETSKTPAADHSLERLYNSPPALLQSVELKSLSDDKMQAVFHFAGKVRYQLADLAEHKALEVTLNNSRFLDTTRLPKSFGFIKAINLKKYDADLQLRFDVAKKTEVVGLNFDDANNELRLTLFHHEAKKYLAENKPKKTIEKTFRPLTPQQTVRESYAKATEYMEAQRPKKAISILKKSLVEFPNAHPLRELLATIYVQENQIEPAKKLLQSGLAIKKDYVPFVMLLARIELRQGKPEQALIIMKSHQPSLEQSPEYYAMIAALYQKTNKTLEAAELYAKLVELRPEKGVWWLGLGVSLERLNRFNQALVAYQRAIKTGSLSADLRAYVSGRITTLSGVFR